MKNVIYVRIRIAGIGGRDSGMLGLCGPVDDRGKGGSLKEEPTVNVRMCLFVSSR